MVENKVFQKHIDIVSKHSGNTFLKLRMDHIRYLEGDATAAVVFSYILNILHMKSKCDNDRELLQKHDMWFRCPAKNLENDLNIWDGKRIRAITVLREKELLEFEYRKNNVIWVKVNSEKLEELDKLNWRNVEITSSE